MMKTPASIKRQQLINEYLTSPLEIGEEVAIKNERGKLESMIVQGTNGDEVTLRCKLYNSVDTYNRSNVIRSTTTVGANPFVNTNSIRTANYNLDNIVFNLDLLPEPKRDEDYTINGIVIKTCSFNPYVTINGIKTYYQRPLVWSIADKQLLIDSIYNYVSCGSVLIRKLEWEELEILANNGETELSFYEVVDGKQRLNAIKEFINNEFPDSYGNYFSDLSMRAQIDFGNSHSIAYTEISKATDKQVLQEFLKVNFAGVPQSREHIDFVSQLYRTLS